MTITTGSSDLDFFAEDVIVEPYEHYRTLRDAGPAVWLERHGVFAVSRYADVRAVLTDWETYSSASGVAMNDTTNATLVGTTLASDPPLHTRMRNVVGDRLTPRALRPMREQVQAVADALVAEVVAKGAFDVVADLAREMPLQIVPDMLGFPHEVRARLFDWAAAGFDTMGPPNARTAAMAPVRQEFVDYAIGLTTSGNLPPGSLTAGIMDAAERGLVDREQCPALVLDYLVPSVDTTTSAIGNAVWLFARHPDQWARLRANPSLVGNALNEVIRFESPVRCFSRRVTHDTAIGGTPVAAGSRVLVVYASANRDERFWDDPHTFDITRQAAAHVGFGYGIHGCAGQGLARLEAQAVLTALLRTVERFDAGPAEIGINNVIRSLTSLPVTVTTERS